jgi:hypothetical protein
MLIISQYKFLIYNSIKVILYCRGWVTGSPWCSLYKTARMGIAKLAIYVLMLGCAKPTKPLVPIKSLSHAKLAYPSDLYLKRFLLAKELLFSL